MCNTTDEEERISHRQPVCFSKLRGCRSMKMSDLILVENQLLTETRVLGFVLLRILYIQPTQGQIIII